MTEPLVGYHSFTSCGRPVQLVILLKLLGGMATENSESFISFLFTLHSSALPLPSTKMCVFFCDRAVPTHFLSCCHLSVSPALMLSLHHNLWPTDDPERQLLFKTYAQQQQQTAWWREGKERGGGVERWRSTRLTSSFLLLCSCIMHGTAVHISRAFWTWCTVYIHAQDGTFSLQSTALYGVGECACLRGSCAICQMLWVAP